ncbi:condensation domain-containing protein [Lentzea sp. NPDC059081]|uniref:condensation domain-containing protein n=1 Tax=Lentzea sp. NPDC059081 TaxID=3346719 RepID=UPI0036BA49CB
MQTTDASARVEFEDIYPLTPMQNGILFHTLRSRRSGPYLEQFVFDVEGSVDAARLADAWTVVVNRHPTLRAAFVWEGVDEPVQVVVPACAVPLREVDLTGRRDGAFAAFLAEDRAEGFVLSRVPLMRLTLVRDDEGTVVVWTLHHLVMDGWSMPITINEVAAVYRASAAGEVAHLPPAGPFRDFLSWLAKQPKEAATRFWSDRLDGVSGFALGALPAGRACERRGTAVAGRGYHDLSSGLSASLVDAAQRGKVTLNTLFQTAWALLLSRITGRDDVTFGATVSGRPADLAGVENIVGVFINTIPQRVVLDEDQPVAGLLREVQRTQLDSSPYQHIGLTEIQSCAGVPAGTPLFDSIVVFENYPSENPDFDLGGGSGLVVREIVEDTGYPLTLTVLPRHPSIRLQLLYDTELFDDDTATTLQGRFEAVLESLVSHLDGTVRGVSAVRREHAAELVESWQAAEVEVPGEVAPGPVRLHLLDRRGEPVPAGVPGAVHLVVDGSVSADAVAGWSGRHLADGSVELIAHSVTEDAGDAEAAAGKWAPGAESRAVARALCALWTEVLGRAVVDPETDFFRSGGDSLAAVRLVGRMKMTFETDLSVNDVFEVRTLGALIGLLDAELGAEAVDRQAAELLAA